MVGCYIIDIASYVRFFVFDIPQNSAFGACVKLYFTVNVCFTENFTAEIPADQRRINGDQRKNRKA